MFPRTFASEFPHDNPALSDGVTWLCPSVCAAPLPCAVGVLVRAERRPAEWRPTEQLETLPPVSVAEERVESVRGGAAKQAVEAAPRGPGVRRARRAVAAVPTPVADSPDSAVVVAPVARQPETAFQRFLSAMVRAALEQGATHVAAELPILLGESRLRPWLFDESAQRALRTRGYLAADGGAASPAFARAADGWRRVLEGTSDDLSACGEKTLDEWGSALLACLLGRAPQAADELRRALRGAGVAAFGMRDAA